MTDTFITKDGYHIEDILAFGRCLVCGSKASESGPMAIGEKDYLVCDELDCRSQLAHNVADIWMGSNNST